MAKFCFTGNPFVDAGIGGMCAAAGVQRLAELDKDAVGQAVDTLLRLMTDDAVFRKRSIGKKETAFATSEMTVIFPNGPLSQSSYRTDDRKREEYKKRVLKKYEGFKGLMAGQAEDNDLGTCFVDGNAAFALVGNDEFPLVDSKNKRNFHPGLQGGHAIGALTALALEFFPLSVLRTGVNSGFFWFVHTADENIAVACARMTLASMNAAISRSEGLGFFGDWRIPSRDIDAALVALIRDLMLGSKQEALSRGGIKQSEYPVTAYVFSNDNRGANIAVYDLPHELFGFFGKMRYRNQASDSFNSQVLQNEHIGWRAAKKMLARESIVNICAVRPEAEKPGRLRGGWEAHILYATEVLGMSSTLVRDVEAISERILTSEKSKEMIFTLQKEGANAALLRLTRQEVVTFDEYAQLVPPEDRRAAFTARDYLLAAIYARQSAEANGETFLPWNVEQSKAMQDKHPLIRLAELVGGKLAADPDLGKKAAFDLAKSHRLPELRGAFLRIVRRGILSWNDFVQVFPPDEQRVSYLMRDYLLAFLYDALRDPDLPEPDLLTDKAIGETQE